MAYSSVVQGQQGKGQAGSDELVLFTRCTIFIVNIKYGYGAFPF